jgi:hypothetical protein
VNHLDAQDPLHTIVRDALCQDADLAPELPEDWYGVSVAWPQAVSSNWSSRRRIVVAVAAAAAFVAGLVIVTHIRGNDPRPASPPAWRPAGIEFPTIDLGPASTVWDGPVVEALTRRVGVEGHPPQVVTRSMSYSGHDTAVEQACTWEGGSGGCRLVGGPFTWSNSITSSVDNGVADFDLWTVEGLPTEVAFVSYVDGDQVLWQRPIAGFAAFPNVPGNDEVTTAYDADGVALGRFDSSTYNSIYLNSSFDSGLTPRDDIPPAAYGQFDTVTRKELAECLTASGGTIGTGNVTTFATDADQLAVWSRCVQNVQAIVAEHLADYLAN